MNLGVVIVTYNRLTKLSRTLECFRKQSLLPKCIVVVNNASVDGTKRYLHDWKSIQTDYEKVVINNNKNIGGSGGFYTGLHEILKHKVDWVWVSDDDAYPDVDALKTANEFIESKKQCSFAAICGTVYYHNTIDIAHRRRIKTSLFKIYETKVPAEEYSKPFFELNEFSYVGSIINKKALIEQGLTKKDYFIHYDDTEHSLRLNKWGKIICVPKIKIIHDITLGQNSNSKDYNSSWQKYYDYRNLLDMYKGNFPKRFFRTQYLIYKIKCSFPKLFGLNNEERKIMKTAIDDFKNGRFGINSIYKPGYHG